ncbi:hypothetical protein [Candidatus Albibeggiatoa sp. nov. NOAA]|uniref:hypothetical protein n=1 Tax=Candidatus Albibeggiatoa sp. nov. NOAA TaxID=3162724 RepID=UPI0032FD72F1|nr:hypothetical protein [Thiotrichaceae bacterium]
MHNYHIKTMNKIIKIFIIILMTILLGAPSCEEQILERMRTVYRFDNNTKKVCVVAAWPASSSKQISEKFDINSIAGANKFNVGIESYLRKYKAKTIEIISYSTLRKPPKQCNAVYQQSSVANYKKCIQAWAKSTKKLGNCKSKTTKVVTVGSYFNKNDISVYVLGAKNTFAKTLKAKQGKNRSASAVNVANRLKTYIRKNK